MKEFRLKSNSHDSGISENLSASLPVYSIPVKIGPQTDYGSNRWEVYSPKLKRNITLYSNLEFDHWTLIEFDSDVETFCEQPLKIRIKLPIGVVTSIFDMWIRWRSGLEEFREVKFEDDLQNDSPKSRVKRQIQAQKRWCEISNKKYSVITEKTIRSNLIYLSNLKLILRHITDENNEQRISIGERINRILSDRGTCSIKTIEDHLSDEESFTVRSIVFEMLYRGRLTCDLEKKNLDLNSVMEVGDVQI